eukprot:TRINITY_DN8928_c0_g1_i1.p1 TRINITY_DN8928_c0_g1~~TRINITY_DN8928_c0_g1_i1.p1  ORF type:complete len:522 (-),score=65.22 TRINITY_DN8928_c0_g1_i1:109-1674(-)
MACHIELKSLPLRVDKPSYDWGFESCSAPTPDGRLVLTLPGHDSIFVYNPTDGTKTEFGDFKNCSFGGCTPIPSGRIVFSPLNHSSIVVFDPVNGACEEFGHFVGIDKFGGCATLLDGRVVLAPLMYASIVIFDPADGSVKKFRHNGSDNKFGSCTVLKDGRVLFAPLEYSSALLFDPSNGSYKEVARFGRNEYEKFKSCTTLHDGRVLLAPCAYPTIVLFNPTDGSCEEVDMGFELEEGMMAFSASATMPDGRVVLTPYNHSSIVVFDPASGGCECVGHFDGTTSFRSSSLMPDGTLILVQASHYSSFRALSCASWRPKEQQADELSDCLWKDRLYTDAVIVAGDGKEAGAASAAKRIPVHRAVLASKSEFFRTLFESSFRESVDAVVHLPEDAVVVESVLECLYTGRVPKTDLVDVILLAHRLSLTDCVCACAAALQKEIPRDRIISALRALRPLHSQPAITDLWNFLLERIQTDKALLADVVETIAFSDANVASEQAARWQTGTLCSETDRPEKKART